MQSTLQLAGLGEKHLELYGDADDLHFALLENFPRLVDGGGYELLRLNGKGGKELILPSEGYTPPQGQNSSFTVVYNIVHYQLSL